MVRTLLAVLMALTLVSATAMAAEKESDNSLELTVKSLDEQETTRVYNLSDLSFTDTDEDGVMPLIDISASTLKSGYRKTYSQSDESWFYVTGGTTVTFTVKLKSAAHVVMGYVDSSGKLIQTYDGSNKTNTTKISMADTGLYKFYITNVSSDAIEITGGSITY